MSVSFSARRLRGRGSARLAAGTLVTGLVATTVLAAGAGTASAGDSGTMPQQHGAAATIDGLKTYGAAVIHGPAGDTQVSAGLFEMSVEGGGMLQTYCVDIHTPTQQDAKYHETSWSGTSLGTNKDSGRILWILEHSYPQVNDLAALAEKAGVHGQLTEQDAAAGTQVAIWRHSDGVDVEALDPQAEQLADYLAKKARDVAEPEASLTLDPPVVAGRPGERLGPVTVRTDARSVTVSPPADAATSGVRIVDAKGEPVTTAGNGSKLYVEVPADAETGSAQLTVQAATSVPVGRAFVSESRSQAQILAGSSESTVSATAVAGWAATGAIPAVSARENCAAGAVDVTVANEGDAAFAFELAGAEYTVEAGSSHTVTVPLNEDQPYDFTVVGPDGFQQRFTGMLDCRTRAAETGTTTQTLTGPSPTPLSAPVTDTNLAETGASSATPWITGTAIALVVLGGAGLVFTRRRQEASGDNS
ncbi:Cys-Gln thioester bond-forming surface protein [Streptomyces pseudogriseolus]|uniref:Cys-Gln thioester bond-forming surface protein n=1 Tax=Streptomyces pseudogriseolus TaxID=36817 RepID=UPI003FA1D524